MNLRRGAIVELGSKDFEHPIDKNSQFKPRLSKINREMVTGHPPAAQKLP
jgi:hypothetical protein